MTRELVLSVTLKDCRVDTFRAGGKGGQKQNKTESGVRITHEPSGAVGESREHRDQLHNKRAAFLRMAQHPKMTFWIRRQLAGLQQGETRPPPEGYQLAEQDCRFEVREHGRWVVTDL
jgi:hypothetical protein